MKFVYVLALTGLFLSQSVSVADEKNPSSKRPAISVITEKAGPVKQWPVRRYVGSVEAVNSVNIIPRITGELRKVHFQEGSMVNAGDLLYELEDTTYLAAVQVLEAQIEAQKAALEFAASEYDRKYKLLKSNVVATAAHEQALMEINMAKANLKRLEASLRDAENTLSYTRIHSPISGRIGKNLFSIGNLITPQSGALTDVQQLAPIHVKFSISEKVLRRDFGSVENLRKNAKVQVKLADGTLLAEEAHVALVDNKINFRSNTVTMWALFKNLEQDLLPGSFVTVLLQAEKQTANQAVTVMPSALIMEETASFIWVLDTQNNIPQRRRVKVGDTVGGRLIILDGIRNGETVIVDGTHKVRPGIPVAPVPAEQLFSAGK